MIGLPLSTMPHELIPAATLILFRAGSGTADDHLFVERAETMRFAAGATVFPGGRIDPEDRAFAVQFKHLELDDAAARITAIRETLEETGLLIGTEPVASSLEMQAIRQALHAGTAFAKALQAHGLTLSLDGLVPFARWCPNFSETRNFDTRFYIAHMPDTDSPLSADDSETVHLFWATAAMVLERANSGKLSIIFPTRRNLERLAMLERYEMALAQTRIIPAKQITPWIDHSDGVDYLTIPDNLGYPITREMLATAKRA